MMNFPKKKSSAPPQLISRHVQGHLREGGGNGAGGQLPSMFNWRPLSQKNNKSARRTLHILTVTALNVIQFL